MSSTINYFSQYTAFLDVKIVKQKHTESRLWSQTYSWTKVILLSRIWAIEITVKLEIIET